MTHRATSGPLARARQLGPLFEDCARDTERERRLPEKVLDALFDAGLFRLLLPRCYGGSQVEPVVFMEVLEEIARHDASTAWCVGQAAVCATTAAYLEPAAANTIFDDARALLAWGAAAPPPNAIAVPGGYRVSGSWSFASGGYHATWLGGHCVVADPDGTPRRGADDKAITCTLIFPASEAVWSDVWKVIGLNGTGSDRYSVTEIFVPEEFSVERDAPAERRLGDPLYRLRTDHLFAGGFAAVAIGIARGLLDAYLALAREKTPRGYPTTLQVSTAVQCEVAELEARLRAARAYLFATMEAAWDEVQAGELPLEERMAIRLASTHCIREAHQVATDAYVAGGTTSIFADNAFERRLRDINSVSQQLQGRRTHFETVGRYLLGVGGETTFL